MPFCVGTWIMLIREKAKDKTEGGIILPDSHKAKNAPFKGAVQLAGPECKYVKAGDQVMFDRTGAFTDVVEDYNKEGELIGTAERVFLKEEHVMLVGNRDFFSEPKADQPEE